MTSYRLKLPYARPPISANDRPHHMARARTVAQVRTVVAWLVKAANVPPASHVTVGLEYAPKLRRRRDGGENYAGTLKAVVDAVVDAGVIRDDTPDLVTRTMPVVLPVSADSGVWLTLDVAPAEAS